MASILAALGVGAWWVRPSRASQVTPRQSPPAPPSWSNRDSTRPPPCPRCNGYGEIIALRESTFQRRVSHPCPDCQSVFGKPVSEANRLMGEEVGRVAREVWKK